MRSSLPPTNRSKAGKLIVSRELPRVTSQCLSLCMRWLTTTMFVAVLWVSATGLLAQSTGPSSLYESADPATRARYGALYAERPPFVVGWNWGAATRQVNIDLFTNTVHADYPFAYSSPRYREPWVTVESYPAGTHLIMAPQWFLPQPLIDSVLPWYSVLQQGDPQSIPLDLGKGNRPSLAEAIGLRFQAELDVSDTTTFRPRNGDTQGAVWGFRYRNSERVREEADPGRPNHQRLVIRGVDNDRWTRVLGASWPQDRFCEWTNMNELQQMAPFNGRRNYLAVHLRRVGDLEPDVDSVLRIRVYYTRCGASDTNLIVFDSIPQPTAERRILPATLGGGSRGSVQTLRSANGGATELVVNDVHVPSEAFRERDVTVTAHFLADGVQNPRFRDRWRVGKAFNAQERRDGPIDRLWIEVEHRGRTSVAIDWVQIGTENMTWLTQGWYDQIFQRAYTEMASNMAAYNRLRFGTDSAEHLRIWRWYMRDEAPEAWWEGIRYVNTLLDGRGLTENELDVDHARFRHLTAMDHSWEGLTLKITPDILTPFYDHGHGGDPEKLPRYLGYRFGVKDEAWETKERFDYDTHPKVGLQAPYEKLREELHENPRYLFVDDHDWIANLWLCGDWLVHERTNLRGASYTPRQLTGEEASLLAWSQIVLGAKGLVYWWGANADSLTQLEHYRMRGYVAPGLAYGPIRPRVVQFEFEPSGRPAVVNVKRQPDGIARERSLWQHEQHARSATAGGDWLTSDNPTGLYQALEEASSIGLTESLPLLIDDTSRRQFYLGWLSVRSALQSIGEVVKRAADTIAALKLRAWHCRGFTSWTMGQGALDSIVDLSRVRTRHPLTPGTWDAGEETFVEVTLLEGADPDTRVIGVLNRRCNPHDVAAPESTSSSFLPYEAHRRIYEDRGYRLAKYRQRGARMVAVPLLDGVFTEGKPIRVRALGRDDLVIELDAPTTILVPMLPGEGILLAVDSVD